MPCGVCPSCVFCPAAAGALDEHWEYLVKARQSSGLVELLSFEEMKKSNFV
jgi:hypothetical protein